MENTKTSAKEHRRNLIPAQGKKRSLILVSLKRAAGKQVSDKVKTPVQNSASEKVKTKTTSCQVKTLGQVKTLAPDKVMNHHSK